MRLSRRRFIGGSLAAAALAAIGAKLPVRSVPMLDAPASLIVRAEDADALARPVWQGNERNVFVVDRWYPDPTAEHGIFPSAYGAAEFALVGGADWRVIDRLTLLPGEVRTIQPDLDGKVVMGRILQLSGVDAPGLRRSDLGLMDGDSIQFTYNVEPDVWP